LPDVSGYTSLITNFGEISNTGVEIGLDITPVKLSNGFTWNVYTNYTQNKNIVEDLINGVDRITLQALFAGSITPVLQKGLPYGALLGSVSARDDEGNLLIDPANGSPIPALEQQVVGNPNPDFLLGVTNTFSFKGFSLNVLIDYRHGGDIWSNSIISMLGRGVTKDTEDREVPQVVPGVYGDPNTLEPIRTAEGNKIQNTTQITTNDLYFAVSGGDGFGINSSDEWGVFDATIFRIRELGISYKFPKSVLSKTPFGSATISVTGRNLFYNAPGVPKHSNFDPESNSFGATNTQGIEYANPPSIRRYGVNLRFTL